MYKRTASALSVLLLCLASLTIVSWPAQAATNSWPQDISAVANNYIQSLPNGSVVAANCSNAQTAVQTFSAIGALTWSAPQRTDGLLDKSCYNQGAVGKDGTVFGIASNDSNQVAAFAYRGGVRLWEKHFSTYCANLQRSYDRAITAMLVGADGYLYVASVLSQCFSGLYIDKFDAGSGQIVFEKQLARYALNYIALSSSGVVLQDTSRAIHNLGYDGNDFAPTVTATGWVQSTDMNSRAFTVGVSDDSCSTSTLQMYTPNVATPFNFTVPACWQIQQVTATSAHGAAILAFDQDGKPNLTSYTSSSNGFTAHSVTLSDTDGYRSFLEPNNPYGAYLPMHIATDVNGNILLTRQYTWQQSGNNLAGWQFTLQSPDLNVMSGFDTNAFDFQQTARFARDIKVAFANDQLYIAVGYCTSADPSQCGTQSDVLYAARLPRLGMDYPRGAILGASATTPTCKTVTFVGVRGSGEDAFAYEGLGQTVQAAKDQLVAGVMDMDIIPVPYPAIPVGFDALSYSTAYSNSVQIGAIALTGILAEINKDCPKTQVVLVGYSQGAQVVGDTLDSLPTALQNQIKALVLFGDPRFNPQLTVDAGTFNTSLYGVWATPGNQAGLQPRQFPSSMTSQVKSYCIAGDPICNYTEASLVMCKLQGSNCPHMLYAPDWTQQAVNWVRVRITS